MAEYKLIAADSHIVEPPNMHAGRIEPRLSQPGAEDAADTGRRGIKHLEARRYAGRDPRAP